MLVVEQISFNVNGSLLAAAFLSFGPIIMLAGGAIVRGRLGRTEGWELSKRFRHVPIAALVLVYYGILYWWLFYDQFYHLRVRESGSWELIYLLPTRSRTVSISDIEAIDSTGTDARTHRMTRIRITLKDGSVLESSQIGLRQAPEYLKALRSLVQEKTPGEQRGR